MEARAAQKLHTAPVPSKLPYEESLNDKEKGESSQIESRRAEVDYESDTLGRERPAEEGIMEVDLQPPAEDLSKTACLSPLTTASR